MTNNEHSSALETLIDKMRYIDESPSRINWLMKEPKWFHSGSSSEYCMCDILVGYSDGTGGAWELKYSPSSRTKAEKQLINGENMLNSVFGIQEVRKKIIFYHRLPIWEYEIIS